MLLGYSRQYPRHWVNQSCCGMALSEANERALARYNLWAEIFDLLRTQSCETFRSIQYLWVNPALLMERTKLERMSNSSVTTYCEEANENWNSHLVSERTANELSCFGLFLWAEIFDLLRTNIHEIDLNWDWINTLNTSLFGVVNWMVVWLNTGSKALWVYTWEHVRTR